MKLEDRNLFRLASVLYRDDNFSTSEINTIRKIIESIYINENYYYSVNQLAEIIKKSYALEFTKQEVYEALNLNITHLKTKENSYSDILYKLTESRYKYLRDNQSLSIIEHIDKFIEENDYESKYKESILDFLYLTFTSNLNNYKLLLNKEDNFNLKDLDMPSNFTDLEIKVINEFLLEDNLKKNKEIYKIVNLSLEYCILTGGRDFSGLNLLKGKKFYLDSNIIYRALGLNGEQRKKSMIDFLDKCLMYDIDLKILESTDQEFKNSLDYNIKKLENRNVSSVNPILASKYPQENINNAYYLWMSGREEQGIDKFKAWALGSYQGFLKDYSIHIDNSVKINTESENYLELLSSISKYKSSDESPLVIENDVKMVQSLKKIRANTRDPYVVG